MKSPRSLILASFLLMSVTANAQFFDAFEEISVPRTRDRLEGYMAFFKQFGVIKESELLKKDSILFFINDTLKTTYRISNLRRFKLSTDFADSVLKASKDSVVNKKLNSYDFYFKDGDTRVLEHRKFRNDKGIYVNAESYEEGTTLYATTTWKYDNAGKLASESTETKGDSVTYTMRFERQNGLITKKTMQISKKGQINSEQIVDYDKNGNISAYKSTRPDRKGVKKTEEFKVERDAKNQIKTVKGSAAGIPTDFTFTHSQNTIEIVGRSGQSRSVIKFGIL